MEKVVFTVKCPGRNGEAYSITKSRYAVNKCKCKVTENDAAPEDICDTWRYPGSEVPRFELPSDAKSLKSELLFYDPPQLEDRAHAKYEDMMQNPERWPKNKVERTGFKGFGYLKPGANPVLYLVVIRGQKQDEELLLEKEGQSYRLPQYHPEEQGVKKEFIKKKVDDITRTIGCDSDSEKAFQNRKRLYKGYILGDQNTDNAWTEGKIVEVHLSSTACSVAKPKDAGKHVWVKVKNTNTGTVEEMIKPLMHK
ncbi:hypothetical protein D918_02999 [Trichuris suis]|nr:hypothetical protein D918_02999 [Trichuris suis]